MVVTKKLSFTTSGDFYALNITDQVRAVLQDSGIKEGTALVYYEHTTGAIMIIEHEVGILVDLEDVLEEIVPRAHAYKHHLRGYDSNGAAHVRTALLNVSVTIPVSDAELMLGSYQEIILVDMDPQGRSRNVIVQVMGESG
jgi:secondary thiamine-phosphate synthase enzyme